MEAVIYSENTIEKIIDCIENLLLLECNNIWVWTTYELHAVLNKEEWEDEVHIFYSEDIISIGDCLRELYIRDETRSNLIVIGDLENCPQKFSLHKNGFGKNIATIMFCDGNVNYNLTKGSLSNYGEGERKGYALDIAYCSPLILAIFYEHFDCNSFHHLLLSDVYKNNYGIKMDKRIKYVCDDVTHESNKSNEEELTFMEELKTMLEIDMDSAKLELNSLRMAHGMLCKDLISGLKELNASQELINLF